MSNLASAYQGLTRLHFNPSCPERQMRMEASYIHANINSLYPSQSAAPSKWCRPAPRGTLASSPTDPGQTLSCRLMSLRPSYGIIRASAVVTEYPVCLGVGTRLLHSRNNIVNGNLESSNIKMWFPLKCMPLHLIVPCECTCDKYHCTCIAVSRLVRAYHCRHSLVSYCACGLHLTTSNTAVWAAITHGTRQ